jgi:hypothetical protein
MVGRDLNKKWPKQAVPSEPKKNMYKDGPGHRYHKEKKINLSKQANT